MKLNDIFEARMTPAQQAEIDAIFKKVGDENKARYAAEPEPNEADVAKEAKFLKGWAKKKAITKVGGDDNSFWKCGSRMTKLSPKMVDALVKHEYATKSGNSLTMTDNATRL